MSVESKFLIGSAVVGLGAVGLYYLTAGWGREKNAALMPDALEDRLDMVVEALNGHVGKDWVDRGAEGLKKALRTVLPGPLVALVDVVHAVETEATRQRMSGNTKQRRAQATAVEWGLA